MSLKDFQIIQKLGEGAYSSVYKVLRLIDQTEYALKKVDLKNLSEKETQNALNEVRILASIKNPYIIGYKEVFLTESKGTLWFFLSYYSIIMEYSDSGDLFQKIQKYQKAKKNIKEQVIWSIFIQIVRGLKVLHSMKIFHRDLKSANIFLNKNGLIKLGDLNVSKLAKKGLLLTQTGTPYYASPEVWRDLPYDNKSDIWSLGCVLYEICTLNPPFRASDMEGLFNKVVQGQFTKLPKYYSQDLNLAVSQLLKTNPQQRPSCEMILQNWGHKFEQPIENQNEENYVLLSTIRHEKNMSQGYFKLPQPNYTQQKIRLERFENITKSVQYIHKDDKMISNQSHLPKLNLIDRSPEKNQKQLQSAISNKLRKITNKETKAKKQIEDDKYYLQKNNQVDNLQVIYGSKKPLKIKPLSPNLRMKINQDIQLSPQIRQLKAINQ